MQTKKWAKLINQGVDEYCVEGIDLLKAMEQSVDEEFLDQEDEKNGLLSKEVVDNLSRIRENKLCMELCDKKKSREPAWGPVLVERKRRGQNLGGSMMQRAMELKKRKNLEPVKGNKFDVLQYD
jgi:predicted GNAT family N-acyltransferase